MELLTDSELFPEFDANGDFHSSSSRTDTAAYSYTYELDRYYRERLAGHIQQGGYNQSPNHCKRYVREIWEAGEFALENHVQAGRFGMLPEENYDCFTARKHFGIIKQYGFSYFDQLKKHVYSDQGIPILERYLVRIKRAHKSASENLTKFFKLIIENAAILVLLVSILLYGKYLFGDNYSEKLASLTSEGVWKLFIYLVSVFILVPILVFFVQAHREQKGISAFFYHPFLMTLMMLLSLLSAFFGLGMFSGIGIRLLRIFYLPPLIFYGMFYILDAVNLYKESLKIKYEKVWRQEYVDIFEQDQEAALRYIRFRILWYQQAHGKAVLPFYLAALQNKYLKYYRYYNRCLKHLK